VPASVGSAAAGPAPRSSTRLSVARLGVARRRAPPASREHVIERALATADDALSLEQLKLIVVMVLWNQQAPASQLVAEELLSARGARLPS